MTILVTPVDITSGQLTRNEAITAWCRAKGWPEDNQGHRKCAGMDIDALVSVFAIQLKPTPTAWEKLCETAARDYNFWHQDRIGGSLYQINSCLEKIGAKVVFKDRDAWDEFSRKAQAKCNWGVDTVRFNYLKILKDLLQEMGAEIVYKQES